MKRVRSRRPRLFRRYRTPLPWRTLRLAMRLFGRGVRCLGPNRAHRASRRPATRRDKYRLSVSEAARRSIDAKVARAAAPQCCKSKSCTAKRESCYAWLVRVEQCDGSVWAWISVGLRLRPTTRAENSRVLDLAEGMNPSRAGSDWRIFIALMVTDPT
jgi:hypothetical protein